MPRGPMDDLEGEVADEKLHECALGHDILSADLNCEDSLLLNICEYRAFGVSSREGNLKNGCFYTLVVKKSQKYLTKESLRVITNTNYH